MYLISCCGCKNRSRLKLIAGLTYSFQCNRPLVINMVMLYTIALPNLSNHCFMFCFCCVCFSGKFAFKLNLPDRCYLGTSNLIITLDLQRAPRYNIDEIKSSDQEVAVKWGFFLNECKGVVFRYRINPLRPRWKGGILQKTCSDVFLVTKMFEFNFNLTKLCSQWSIHLFI